MTRKRAVLNVAMAAAACGTVTLVRIAAAARHHPERPRGDVIAVFGALVRDGRPSRELQARIDEAVTLHRALAAPRVVCLGGRPEVEAMRAYLLRAAVPRDAVDVDDRGTSTRAAVDVLRERHGDGPVLVVSSPYHLRRILSECRRAGIDAVGCPARGLRPACRSSTVALETLREVPALWWYALRPAPRR